ncbi:electron transport complex subunit RsxC [Rheinheimera sp. 4Y26]|uniref:electron transport complex subunit RsxC n=1 Tax=Rheinheimera sp. 4Y26 TaxID=2977811 RepID=UPI0021B14D09|nr:electron transport complex subunit RsxC [Rheinheimera sp. 4Y26]MCT6700659.1 electron transport complex subunit RsxC [Rheinheimera sp. 4Y26]
MPSLFQQIKAGKLWDFHGGIHPPARKDYTSQKPIGRLSLPERLYVPLRQHIGVAGALLVKTGQRVLKGQALTAADSAMAVPVHAPTSGIVLAIEPHIAAHPSALPEPCVVIEPDGLEEWRPRHGLNLLESDKALLLKRIQQAGIAGMGGAGFPTHLKSGGAAGVDYLIINAVECEPYISADDVLMQEYATTIVKGIDILCQLLSPAAVLIGIEDDKPDAIAAMQAACSQREQYLVRVVPAKYPSGGEKQLIQLLTSKEVPAGRRPLDIGIVMQNVGTAFAIAQAVLEDIPLISRIVTVTGDSLSQPQNMHALIGTPVGALLDACGFIPQPEQRVIMGGPMMGFTLPSLSVPLVKTTNCILAPTQQELPSAGPEMDCIRCGACAEVCPATLLPQQLLWYSKAKDQDKLKEYNLADCIECGACAYVCPSEIPLVHYYRIAKAEIREQSRDELKAEQAKARFEARNERLEKEKQERAARNQALAAQRQQMLDAQQKQQEIAAAAERVASSHPAQQPLSKEQIIAERERKKAEARAYQAAKEQQVAQATAQTHATAELSDTPVGDARAAAVAAAIARAKAKKATTEAAEQPGAVPLTNTDPRPDARAEAGDERAAAVAAAIARAKAKKAATAAVAADTEPATKRTAADTTAEPVAPAEDPRAAAVAAAIARAKAKKAAAAGADASAGAAVVPAEQAPATQEVPAQAVATAEDPRAAAVAAAIARAKAKKAAQAAGDNAAPGTLPQPDALPEPEPKDTETDSEPASSTTTSAEDSSTQSSAVPGDKEQAKKAALTAAIARAKARQQSENIAATESATALVSPPENSQLDAKKAAIAAAIARAKARQQAATDQNNSEDEA